MNIFFQWMYYSDKCFIRQMTFHWWDSQPTYTRVKILYQFSLLQRPLSIMSKSPVNEQIMNRLVVSGNLADVPGNLADVPVNLADEEEKYRHSDFYQDGKYPQLQMLLPRPLDDSSEGLWLADTGSRKSGAPVVHIYGKAAIGRYLWSHLMEGPLDADVTVPGTLYGNKTMQGVHFIYREGTILSLYSFSSRMRFYTFFCKYSKIFYCTYLLAAMLMYY